MTVEFFSFYLTRTNLDDSFSGAFQRNYTRIQSNKAILIDFGRGFGSQFSFNLILRESEISNEIAHIDPTSECVISFNASEDVYQRYFETKGRREDSLTSAPRFKISALWLQH